MNPQAWKCSFPQYYKRFNFTDELYWVAVAKSNPTSLNPPPPALHTWLALSSWMRTAHLALHCQMDLTSKCGGRSFPRGKKSSGREFSSPYTCPNCFLPGWVSSQGLQQMPKLEEQWGRGQKWSQCCQAGLDWHWELEGNQLQMQSNRLSKEMVKTTSAKFEEQVSNRPLHPRGTSASWALLARRGRSACLPVRTREASGGLGPALDLLGKEWHRHTGESSSKGDGFGLETSVMLGQK